MRGVGISRADDRSARGGKTETCSIFGPRERARSALTGS